jgi:hypothetical protein
LMAVMICRDKIKNKPYCKNRSACMWELGSSGLLRSK